LFFLCRLDNVQRITPTWIGTNIDALWRIKQAGVMEKGTRNKNVLEITGLEPYLKRLGWETFRSDIFYLESNS